MSKKPKISQEDIDAFHAAVKGTTPLIHKKTRVKLSAPKSKYSQPIKPSFAEDEVHLTENQDLHQVQGEEFITFKQAGISNKTLRKLRKGQYNVEAILDLHGKSVEEAKIAVEQFLQHCLRREVRVALIIHGKGHHSRMLPILKNKLNLWLRELDIVLAFCSAAPTHGSRGAIYIMLKRSTEETFS